MPRDAHRKVSGIQTISNTKLAGQQLSQDREAFLVSRVIRRDLRAFQELYGNYHPRLTRFLARMTESSALVEELVNDTMMVVWERLDNFKGESKLSTWIFAIAYRKAAKALKAKPLKKLDEKKETIEHLIYDATQESDLHGQKVHALLRDAMIKLSPDHRAVVDLVYFHDLGYREIAEIMDSPVDTVKTRMFYARRALKAILSGELVDWL